MVLRLQQNCSGYRHLSPPALRHILHHAVACGHVPSTPARGIKFSPARKITRFIFREEFDPLHKVLDRHERSVSTRASQRHQIDIIRLLLMTGYRKNEIAHLRRDVVAGTSFRLRDSKTGPRTVLLNAEARALIERKMTEATEFLFPLPKDGNRPMFMTIGRYGIGCVGRPVLKMFVSMT